MNQKLREKHLKEINILEQESCRILNNMTILQEKHIDVIGRLQILSNKLSKCEDIYTCCDEHRNVNEMYGEVSGECRNCGSRLYTD
tara:strand:- start:161 stop:418 length:258 start_codon:yes stop_codon:yes gene_type:complete